MLNPHSIDAASSPGATALEARSARSSPTPPPTDAACGDDSSERGVARRRSTWVASLVGLVSMAVLIGCGQAESGTSLPDADADGSTTDATADAPSAAQDGGTYSQDGGAPNPDGAPSTDGGTPPSNRAHATVGLRLGVGDAGLDDFLASPDSFPVTKRGADYIYYDSHDGTLPTAGAVFDTTRALVVLNVTPKNSPTDAFTGAEVVSKLQEFETAGWNVAGVWVRRRISRS